MKRDEVIKTLAEYKLAPDDKKSQLVSSVDYVLNPPGMNANFPFMIRTNFSPAGGLDIVMLLLDSAEMVRQRHLPDNANAIALVAGTVDSEFIAKYGSPTQVEGDCADPIQAYASWTVRKKSSYCSKTWKADGQSVSYYWVFGAGALESKLGIQYTALSDL
jgi:hypothetical protein